MKPIIYLAGAIRDDHPEDILWRERFIGLLRNEATLLNPLGGKWQNKQGVWLMSGRVASAPRIVAQDFYCVRHADIVIANFSSMADGYPSIGTVMEVGAATILNKLIYAILRPGTILGVENQKNFKLHPFITENCADVFDTEDEAAEFLQKHIRVLNGTAPNCLAPVGVQHSDQGFPGDTQGVAGSVEGSPEDTNDLAIFI